MGSGPVILDPDDLMPNRSRPGVRVLVVDDYPDNAEGMARLLRRDGHEVDVALDGKTALQRARAKQPDVVLLDICMPGMDGYEVASQLRAMFQNKVRLVAITALGSEEDRKRCLEAGFDLHLVKPVDPSEVRNLLRAVALAKAFSSRRPPGRPPA
jgi:two-component system, chemotaxis family, CheB/CheR fusion protein